MPLLPGFQKELISPQLQADDWQDAVRQVGSLLVEQAYVSSNYIDAAHRGTPVIWAPRYMTMDMSTGFTGLGVEGGLACAAAAQMITEYYGMICDMHGPATNSIVPDGKSVLEESLAGFTTGYLGGPAVLAGAGGLELGLVANFEDLVICNEVTGLVKRIIHGFEINRDTIAAEAIERVGVGGSVPHSSASPCQVEDQI